MLENLMRSQNQFLVFQPRPSKGRFSTHNGRESIVRKILLCLSVAGPMLMPGLAQAQVTAKDVQVAARVLSFTSTPFSGTVKLGIVYDPAVAASNADEQALAGILGSGLNVGSITLVPVPVPVSKLAGAQVDALFLTSGLGAAAAAVQTQATSGKTLCVTTDQAATQAGYCAVSVQSDPKVQITVNKAAAAATGVSFASAFLMMVTEI
jgi:hypothetical protein